MRGRVLPTVQAVLPLVLRIAGARVPADARRRSCLVLAPHGDDEVLGCGATILARRSAGARVVVAYVTDGGAFPDWLDPVDNVAKRLAETDSAAAALGLDKSDVVQLAFPDGLLESAERSGALGAALERVLSDVQPDDVLTTSPWDPHPDHAALGRAVRSAVRPGGPRLLEYPIWQWESILAWPRMLRDAHRPEIVRTKEHRQRKSEALMAYSSQLDVDQGGELPPGKGLPPVLFDRLTSGYEIFFPVHSAAADARARR